jgi:hypothetical protein
MTPEEPSEVSTNPLGKPSLLSPTARDEIEDALDSEVTGVMATAKLEELGSQAAANTEQGAQRQDWSTEGQLVADGQQNAGRRTLPLRKGPGKGKEVDVPEAEKMLLDLDALRYFYRPHFDALMRLAHGEVMNAESQMFFMGKPDPVFPGLGRPYLTAEGSAVLNPLRELILAAQIVTPKGTMLALPFDPDEARRMGVDVGDLVRARVSQLTEFRDQLGDDEQPEQEQGITLPLKKGPGKGKEVDVHDAQCVILDLEMLRALHPQHLEALVALAHGNEISAESRTYLREHEYGGRGMVGRPYLTEDGSDVSPPLRELILAAEVITREGVVLSYSPFNEVEARNRGVAADKVAGPQFYQDGGGQSRR